MLEKIIENWLTNTLECYYESAFRQTLVREGHKVLWAHEHGPLEFGKDIIAIDREGRYCGYQLKSGNINAAAWRRIRGQVMELLEVPIRIPNGGTTQLKQAYLVTNGAVQPQVREEITRMNEQSKGARPKLDIIGMDELIVRFANPDETPFPTDPENLGLFLDVFRDPGDGMLPKEKLVEFLTNSLFQVQGIPPRKRRSHIKNALTIAPIVISCMLSPFEKKKNHFALAEAWIILAACAVRFAIFTGTSRAAWNSTLSLILAEVRTNLSNLQDEVLLRRTLIEGDFRVDGGDIVRVRTTMILGAIAALQLDQANQRKASRTDVIDLVYKYRNKLFYWGDSAFPYMFWLVKYFESIKDCEEAIQLVRALFSMIVEKNRLDSNENMSPLASPYQSVEETLRMIIGLEGPANVNPCRGSYVLESLFEMLVRRRDRELISDNWQLYIEIPMWQFIPMHECDFFAWRTEHGENLTQMPRQRQSWSELTAICHDDSDTPRTWEEYGDLIHFLILVYPHRARPRLIRHLDVTIGASQVDVSD